MPTYGSPLPEDQYDGRADEAYDPRLYHNDYYNDQQHYDDRTYLLTSRRFPDGHLVHRCYSLADCACQVVQLILPDTAALVLAYAMPSELTLA
jgi:hypothetical protein